MEEEWKPIPGLEGFYEASTHGRIRSVDRVVPFVAWGKTVDRKHKGRIMKPTFDGRGLYQQVMISKDGVHKKQLIHRLVAMTFIENPNNLPEVNHIDEDKTNNAVWNLEWCDHKYNNTFGSKADASKGERNGAAKLTRETVRKIRQEYVPNSHEYGINGLAKKYGISFIHVHQIVTRKRWGWLD